MELSTRVIMTGWQIPSEQTLWNGLKEIFDWINQGNRDLGIPPYNGGLFDNEEKPYLANHVINNAYLVRSSV